jgi:hypothetical protein
MNNELINFVQNMILMEVSVVLEELDKQSTITEVEFIVKKLK